MNHIMFDLETLGSNSEAPIVQIAAVHFDLKDGSVLSEFNARIRFDNRELQYFNPDIRTIEWWLSQPEAARTAVFKDEGRVSLTEALFAFTAWHTAIEGKKKFWSHATFDPPVLTNACHTAIVVMQIEHRDFIDIRTLKFLTSGLTIEIPEREGIHHEALADCKFQAIQVSRMIAALPAGCYAN